MSGVGPIVKRAIDVIFSLMVLLNLFPVMAVVVVTIRLMMGGPVFFRQVRPGYRAKPFTLYKFRTMREAYNDRRHAAARCRATDSLGPAPAAHEPG